MRPFTLAELQEVLAVKLGTTALDEGNLMTNIRKVETLCGAFVEIVPAQMSAGQSSEPLADTVC